MNKWGGLEGWNAQKQRHDLKGRGRAVGIRDFNLDRKASNTKMSHRLVLLMTRRYGFEVSEEVYAALSRFHFVEGNALNDLGGIAGAATETLVGLNIEGDEAATYEGIREYLEGDCGLEEIERTYAAVGKMGINSIPNFIVNGTHIIRGAAGGEDFARVFDEVIRDGKEGEFVFKKSLGLE